MRGFKNFKGSDARCPSIHFLFYAPDANIVKRLAIRSDTHCIVLLIFDLPQTWSLLGEDYLD